MTPRVRYYVCENVPDDAVCEVTIGGYLPGGGADGRGEFTISLHDHQDDELSVCVSAFTDGFGALREADEAGVLAVLERSVVVRSLADLVMVLEACGIEPLATSEGRSG